jgi:hypothetical protein
METDTRNLSSIEIRNLMLETLAYEEADIDSEGKTFKMYGYQGAQSDLFRLMEGLCKRKVSFLKSFLVAIVFTIGKFIFN